MEIQLKVEIGSIGKRGAFDRAGDGVDLNSGRFVYAAQREHFASVSEKGILTFRRKANWMSA